MSSRRYPALGWLYANTERAGECLVWKGSRSQRGYGQILVSARPNRYELAHRAALRLAGIEIPEGHDVHHRCGNKSCIRVEHLEVLTRREHMRRHRQEVCQRGHRDEWRERPNGQRECRVCRRERQREQRRAV